MSCDNIVLPSDDSSGIFVTWKVVANDDFLGDKKFNKKHYFYTGNHIRQWFTGECWTLKFCLYPAGGKDILFYSWYLSKILNFSASWFRWLCSGIGTVFRLNNNLNFVFFMLGQWCWSSFIKWCMYLKYRCFLLLREQTWVRSALWGVQYHQLAHGYIYEQLHLVAPGLVM